MEPIGLKFVNLGKLFVGNGTLKSQKLFYFFFIGGKSVLESHRIAFLNDYENKLEKILHFQWF